MYDVSEHEYLIGKKFGEFIFAGWDGQKVRLKCATCGAVTVSTFSKFKSGTNICKCKCDESTARRIANIRKNMIDKCKCDESTARRIANTWKGMIDRCSNPNNPNYHNYGGRGIKVCPEWNDNFYAFLVWAINSGYSPDLTIDRIDNNKGYSPDNCRWGDWFTQANNRRNNIRIIYNGEEKTLREWCRILGIQYSEALYLLRKSSVPFEDIVRRLQVKNMRRLEKEGADSGK